MSEKKKGSAKDAAMGGAEKAQGGEKKKKPRPPPLETQVDPPQVYSSGQLSVMQPGSFALPTMRNMFMTPNQQIVVAPAAQMWDIQEQAQLERLHRVMCFPNESLLNKSIKIAAHLNAKTVRDVACRIKLMEETNTLPTSNDDDVSRFLSKGDAIIAELQAIPPRDRTEQQNARLMSLMKDFVHGLKESRNKLEARQLKLPVNFIPSPEVPEIARAQLGLDKPTSSGAASSSSGGGK